MLEGLLLIRCYRSPVVWRVGFGRRPFLSGFSRLWLPSPVPGHLGYGVGKALTIHRLW
jgi:hypothetical protein